MKFFGVPPPSTIDAVRGRRMMRLADSAMSPMTSTPPRSGARWRAWESPMPIDESAMAGQKTGTLARYAAVRIPSPPVSRHRCPPSRCSSSRLV